MKKNNPEVKRQSLKSDKALAWNLAFLAAISGALLALSFPKYGSGYLTWIALIPLFWAIREASSVRQGLLLGFISGMICHIGLIYWITFVVVNYGYLPIYLGIILMLLLACYLSLYTALFSAGIVFFAIKWPCILRLLFYGYAWSMASLICSPGSPGKTLVIPQYRNHYLIQFADITGVFGLSF